MRRPVVAISAIIAVTVGFVIFFGYQALQTLVAKPKLLRVRECIMLPQPMNLEGEHAETSGTRLVQFGYAITVPWPDRQKDYGNGNVTTNAVFAGGQRITLLNPEKFPDLLDYIASGEPPATENEGEQLRRLFGKLRHEEFYRRLLYAHPSEFSVFMGKQRAKALKLCLVMKVSMLARDSAVFSFHDGERRGFQLGDPKRDTRCDVILFYGSEMPVHFMVDREDGTGALITQRDIDQMISSFQWTNVRPGAKKSNHSVGLPLRAGARSLHSV